MTAPREVTPEAETFLPYRERLAQRVLADLIESGHIIGVTEGGATIVSVEVHPRLLEMLFLFDADVEDMEEGHDAEQINEDGFPGMGVVGCVLEPTEDDEDEGVAVDMSSDGYGRNYIDDGELEPDYRNTPACPCCLSSNVLGLHCPAHDEPPSVQVSDL